MKGKILLIIVSLMLLSGCAVTLTDFNQLKARVDELEKQAAANKAPQTENKSIEEINTLTQQNQHIFTQLQAMNNRLATLENSAQNKPENDQIVVAKESVANVSTTENNDSAVNEADNTDQMNEASVNDVYNEGRRLYEIKDFPGSIQIFNIVIEKYADNELAGPAQYWIGECYYALSDFSAAKAEFQKIVKNYPSSTKYIDAQVKVALCLMNLNQKDKAKTELLRIKKDYPKYERRQVIDELLKKM